MPGAEAALTGPLGPALAIGLMAFATYLCRIGGVVLMNRVRITPAVERALAALPGSIVAATVAPIAIRSGVPAIAGVVAAVVATRLTGSEIASLAIALAVAAGARALGL